MEKHERILYPLFILFFITLYFSAINSVNIVITGLLFVYSIAITSFYEKINILRERKHIQGMVLFFLVLILSSFWSNNHEDALHSLKLRSPLIIFPLSIGLLKVRKTFRDKVLLSFALITLGVCILSLVYSFREYTITHRSDQLYNDNLSLFMGYQSVYIALLVNFAIFILCYFIINKKSNFIFLKVVAILFLIIFNYLLGSRINLGILFITLIGFSFYHLISKRRFLEISALFLGLIILGVLIYKIQPKMLNRFKELTYNEYDYKHMGVESHYDMELNKDQWNGANFRLASWNCGLELFKENPVFGVDLGDKWDELLNKYTEKEFKFAAISGKNVHNNYIDILFSLGSIGFIVFILSWIALPITRALTQNDGLAITLIVAFSVAWVTENYFDRSLGGIIVGFFIPFILSSQRE